MSFGQVVAVGAIAADADADGARRAALALRLPDGVQDAFAHAFEVAVGAAQVIERAGHGILDVLVLAAAALEDQLDLDLVLFPLLEMNDRRFRAQIVAAVLAGERIDGVGPQFAAARGLRDGLLNRLLDARSGSRRPACGPRTSACPCPGRWGLNRRRPCRCSDRIMSKACEDCVSGVSSFAAMFMAWRTSGGRLVDVWVISSSKLPARNSISLPPPSWSFYTSLGWRY